MGGTAVVRVPFQTSQTHIYLRRARGGELGRILSQFGKRMSENHLVSPAHGAGYLPRYGGDGARVALRLMRLQFPDVQT